MESIDLSMWLAQLQQGDDVVVVSGTVRDCVRLYKVTHTTRTPVLVGRERYWRKDGRCVGATAFYRNRLTPPTPELIEQIRRDHAISRLRYEQWENHPNAVLFAVMVLVEGATVGAVDPVGEQVTSGPRA